MSRDGGRQVVITGSSSGVGRAIAEILLEAGHRVLGLARDHDKFVPATDAYTPIEIDLADLDDIAACLDRLARAHPEISAVVANAGRGDFDQLESFSAARIRAAIDLNLTSHLLVARSFLPGLKRKGGDLVVIGSTSGRHGGRGGAVYCAAKFGLRGMAQALREECARSGVRVTLVSAGAVRTPFFDDLDFEPAPGPDNALDAADVARVVQSVLSSPPTVYFDEIVVVPRHRSWRKKQAT